MSKKNLNRDFVRLLRKVQKFLIAEPRSYDMKEGIVESEFLKTILEQPPCGTACCIAGAAYVIDTGMELNHSRKGFSAISGRLQQKFFLDDLTFYKLVYIGGLHAGIKPGKNGWPKFYTDMYLAAKTPLERACVGVARIEHFIATDGQE